MADKYAAKGTTLTINALPVPNFRGITSSGGEAERIDVTTHDSPGNRREFVQGFKGEATVTFEIVYDPNDSTHQALAALFAAGTVVPVIVGLQTTPAQTITFDAFVSNFPIPSTPIDGPLTIEVTLTVTGDITFPTTP